MKLLGGTMFSQLFSGSYWRTEVDKDESEENGRIRRE